MRINEIAAEIHRRMCDDERFGYSWEERWGAISEEWDVDGHAFTVKVGDYDCSSSTITAWRLAVEGTPYEGCFDGATYTGNMRSVFTGSGLFEWVPVNQAEQGDLYLNEANHVAMCQGDGMLSEFSGNEHGGAYGGQRGDQTGWESHVRGYYSYPWDGCLHYNGAADDYAIEEDDLKPVINSGGEVYRLYNQKGFHYLTTSDAEADALKAEGWVREGVAFTAPRGGIHAVYRMYNPRNGDHLYTPDYGEAEGLQEQGWKYEGVPFFAQPGGIGTPVYRLYNPNSGEHFYTADEDEMNGLRKAGWSYEGGFTV